MLSEIVTREKNAETKEQQVTLQERVSELIWSAVGGVYLQTIEPDEALVELAMMCHSKKWKMVAWDFVRGLNSNGFEIDNAVAATAGDPLAVLTAIPSLANAEGITVIVLRGFDHFLSRTDVVLTLDRQLAVAKGLQAFVVILAPVVRLPLELERRFVVIEHSLPSPERLAQCLCETTTSDEELPHGSQLADVLDAAMGLTRHEAEAAFRLSLFRNGVITPEAIWQIKTQLLMNRGRPDGRIRASEMTLQNESLDDGECV